MFKLFLKYLGQFILLSVIHIIMRLFDASFFGKIFSFDKRSILFFVFFILFYFTFYFLGRLLFKVTIKYIAERKQFVRHMIQLSIVFLAYGVLVSVAFSTSYTLFDRLLFNIIHYGHQNRYIDLDANMGMYFGYFIILALNAQYYFINHWKETEISNQRFKEETARSRFEALKNQIEPHFFFNSLSVLSQLVHKDANQAAEYIARLSKLYRYILDQREETLVPLYKEIEILEAYTYMIAVRHGNSITFSMIIDDQTKQTFAIPHNTLQILAENAVKHNQFSKESPLHVELYVNEGKLVMMNNLQKRESVEHGSGIGLQNIELRYNLICGKSIEIDTSEKRFKVSIPLCKL